MIQQKAAKVKGVADIVFCIDFSGSMKPCIQGVKEHVTTFIRSLETSSPNLKIDWRIAFCAYSNTHFIIQDFVTDPARFSAALGDIGTMGDEFTPGAIDFCITHFEWRTDSNRFLFVFTDEPLKGGYSPPEVTQKFPDLLAKIADTKTRLCFFGPKDSFYGQFEQVPRSFAQYLENDDFSSVDFTRVLSALGKTVSQSCGQQDQAPRAKPGLIFDLGRIAVQTI